jgi:hypothetical protein
MIKKRVLSPFHASFATSLMERAHQEKKRVSTARGVSKAKFRARKILVQIYYENT